MRVRSDRVRRGFLTCQEVRILTEADSSELRPESRRLSASRYSGLTARGVTVSQADYVQANSDLDNEIDAVTQQLNASESQHGTLDAFLRFSKLMLVDIAAAWQRADIEQRVRVQNFLFQDGIAYEKAQGFLNTTNATLFQQLRALAHCKGGFGVPGGI